MIVSDFIKNFDPTNEDHVVWLREVSNSLKNNQDFNKYNKLINNNPFKIKIKKDDSMEIAQAHIFISAKYTEAIFDGTAFVPKYYTRQE